MRPHYALLGTRYKVILSIYYFVQDIPNSGKPLAWEKSTRNFSVAHQEMKRSEEKIGALANGPAVKMGFFSGGKRGRLKDRAREAKLSQNTSKIPSQASQASAKGVEEETMEELSTPGAEAYTRDHPEVLKMAMYQAHFPTRECYHGQFRSILNHCFRS